MIPDTIYIKLKELIKLSNQIEKDEKEMLLRQESLATTRVKIKKIINANRDEKRDTTFVFSKDTIPYYQDNNSFKSAFSWKKMIIQTIELHNKFLTVNEIFNFGNIRFPFEMCEKRKSIKNISATLCQLVKDGPVSKIKIERNNFKYGITIKHFDSMGKPLEEFI